jgi:peptidyl-tRNA hydrolase
VEEIVRGMKAGYILKDFNREEYQKITDSIDELMQTNPVGLREEAEAIYSLKKGIKKYSNCYAEIFNK